MNGARPQRHRRWSQTRGGGDTDSRHLRRRSVRLVVQNPYLQVLGFSAIASGIIVAGLQAFRLIADALAPPMSMLPPPVDLWLEYRLVTADGEVVADGARLPPDTVILLERFVGPEVSIVAPQMSLSGLGTFADRSPVVADDGSQLREHRTPIWWKAVDVREAVPLRLRDAGEFSA